MNSKRWLMSGVVLAFGLTLVLFAFEAQSRVVGTLTNEKYYPEMLEKKASCNVAYNDFVVTAKPLKACDDLETAQSNLAVQNALINELTGMKKCRECAQKLTAAREARAGYQEQVNIYSKECPSDIQKKQDLSKKVYKKHDQVCKKCNSKWPGQVALYGVEPCSK